MRDDGLRRTYMPGLMSRAGQLAGAIHGLAGIPPEWLAKLAWRDRIEAMAHQLIDEQA